MTLPCPRPDESLPEWSTGTHSPPPSNTRAITSLLRNGSLIHGHTTAHFDASTVLTEGALQESDPFALHFEIRNADVAELVQLVGVQHPLAGTLNMSATVSGTRANPHGDGHIELHNGTAYGVGVPLLQSDLRLAGGELQFNNIKASAYGAPLSGSAAVSTSNLGAPNNDLSNHEFRLNLSGRNLDLARLPRFADRPLHGRWRRRFHAANQRHARAAFARGSRPSQGPRPGQGARRRFLRRRRHSGTPARSQGALGLREG